MPAKDMLGEAIAFAARAHAGQLRKASRLPYIVHPVEVVSICANITHDLEVLSAAALHDVVEDAGVSIDDVRAEFGPRVAELVAGETEDKRRDRPAAETWKERKIEAIEHLRLARDPGVRVICLADKLSNLRSLKRDLDVHGPELWNVFNQKDPAEHGWYHATIASVLRPELGTTDAWREYDELIRAVFSPMQTPADLRPRPAR
jgi:myo-inositol-1(or 4)-monophosphatase